LKRGIFSLLRTSPDGKEKIITLHNVTDNIQKFCFTKNQYGLSKKEYFDIISEKTINIEKNISKTISNYVVKDLLMVSVKFIRVPIIYFLNP